MHLKTRKLFQNLKLEILFSLTMKKMVIWIILMTMLFMLFQKKIMNLYIFKIFKIKNMKKL